MEQSTNKASTANDSRGACQTQRGRIFDDFQAVVVAVRVLSLGLKAQMAVDLSLEWWLKRTKNRNHLWCSGLFCKLKYVMKKLLPTEAQSVMQIKTGGRAPQFMPREFSHDLNLPYACYGELFCAKGSAMTLSALVALGFTQEGYERCKVK